MTATSSSGTRPAPATDAVAASNSPRTVSVITSSTNNSDTSLDCEIGQKGQLGKPRTEIVGREHGLDVEYAQRPQVGPPVEPASGQLDGGSGKIGREPDPGDPGPRLNAARDRKADLVRVEEVGKVHPRSLPQAVVAPGAGIHVQKLG